MSMTKRYLDELNAESEARGECHHGQTGECLDCEAEWYAMDEDDIAEYMSVSDADPGL
jgi:hypothetical protein